MRGGDDRSGELFSYVDLEARVRRDHPLRAIRAIVNEALVGAGAGVRGALFADRAAVDPAGEAAAGDAAAGVLLDPLGAAADGAAGVRPPVPLVRRDRRRRCGLGPFDLLEEPRPAAGRRHRGEVPGGGAGAAQGEEASVDRSLLGRRHADRGVGVDEELQAEGRPGEPPAEGGGRNAEADFHGQKRSNETHASTTDPDARLYRKGPGKEAKLCFIGHGLMENRYGLLVDACLTPADGHAERVAALHMIEPRADRPRAITLGADKGYDAEDFVNELRSMNVTPHVAQNTSGRRSAIDGRTTRHGGYAVSQRIRKRIEEAFGWIKTVAGQEKTKFRGVDRVGWAFTFAAAAYNLVRLPKLLAEAG